MDKEQISGVPEPENAETGAAYDGLEAEEKKTIENGEAPEENGEAPEESGEAVEENGEAVEENGEAVEENGEAVEENGEAIEESGDDDLCTICGTRNKRENSAYCEECEKAALSRKPPFLAWISGLAAVALGVFALVLVLLASAPSLQAARGDDDAKNKRWRSALEEYDGVFSVTDEISSVLGQQSPFVRTGSGVKLKIIDAIANCYSPLEAFRAAESLLSKEQISKTDVLKKYGKIKDDYVKSYEVIAPAAEKMTSNDASSEEIYAEFEKALQQEGVSAIFINYLYYQATLFYGEDDAKKLTLLKKIDGLARESGEDYSWLYYQDMAEALYKTGETDEAVKYLDALIENDKTKFPAYEMKMRISLDKGDEDEAGKILANFKTNNEGRDFAYVLETIMTRRLGEYEKAKAVCKEALEKFDSVPELRRQLALIHLLEGDYENAYEEAYSAETMAYSLSQYGGDSSAVSPLIGNTLYLCAYLYKETGETKSENSESVDEIIKFYSEKDLSERVKAVADGRKTVKEILTEGACDLI